MNALKKRQRHSVECFFQNFKDSTMTLMEEMAAVLLVRHGDCIFGTDTGFF